MSRTKYTALPSIKGQVTIPQEIREKYKISKNTPMIIEDKGKGIIMVQIMGMIDHDAVAYFEDEKTFGLHFKNGIDPQVLIDAIKKIDG